MLTLHFFTQYDSYSNILKFGTLCTLNDIKYYIKLPNIYQQGQKGIQNHQEYIVTKARLGNR
jgi:hypothetical protein